MTVFLVWLTAPAVGWQPVGLAVAGLALAIIGYFVGRHKQGTARSLCVDLHRACLDNVNQGVAILHPPQGASSFGDFVLMYVNKAACELNHVTAGEIEGARLADAHGTFLNEDLVPWIEFAYSRNLPVRTEISLPRELPLCPLEYEAYAIKVGPSIVVMWTDVTSRTQAETAYQDLFARVPVGVYRITSAGEILTANPALVQLLGFTSVEAMRTVNATDLVVDRRALSDVHLALKRDGVLLGVPLQLRKSDGSLIWIRNTCSVVRDANGVSQYVEGITEDITERYLAVTALRHSEARYRELVENAYELIYSMDMRGTLTSINSAAQRILGYDQNECIGINLEDVVRPKYRQAFRDAIDELAGGARGARNELELIAKCGRPIWLETSMRLRFEAGRPVGIEGIAWDITGRKHGQQELEAKTRELARSNAELEHFAHIASHDLQEPLRMVAGFAELLGDRYRGKLDADADEFIGYMVDGARRMQRMIKDLLAYSRIGTRGQELKPTGAEEALQGALDNLRLRIQESGAVITHARLPWVLADAAQLEQVFQNLVDNAIKFRGADPPAIAIEAEPTGAEWAFTVRDNGLGVAGDDITKLFRIFERGQHDRPGSGLGLAICKRIIDRHGGRIWVEPGRGPGAVFRFTLPAAKDDEHAQYEYTAGSADHRR